MGLLAYQGKKEIARIDKLHESKADLKHVDELMEAHNANVSNQFSAVIERLDAQDRRSEKRDEKLDRIIEKLIPGK